VEKALLQIRNVTNFCGFVILIDLTKFKDTYRFCRLPFGIVCSPFLLEGTFRFHLRNIGTPVAKRIADNIHVDNETIGAE